MYSIEGLLGYRFDSLPAKILSLEVSGDGCVADLRLITGHRARAAALPGPWRVGETVEVTLRKDQGGRNVGLAIHRRTA